MKQGFFTGVIGKVGCVCLDFCKAQTHLAECNTTNKQSIDSNNIYCNKSEHYPINERQMPNNSNINLITVQFLCTGYECSTSTNKDC